MTLHNFLSANLHDFLEKIMDWFLVVFSKVSVGSQWYSCSLPRRNSMLDLLVNHSFKQIPRHILRHVRAPLLRLATLRINLFSIRLKSTVLAIFGSMNQPRFNHLGQCFSRYLQLQEMKYYSLQQNRVMMVLKDPSQFLYHSI